MLERLDLDMCCFTMLQSSAMSSHNYEPAIVTILSPEALKPEKWSNQQLFVWLEEYDLGYLKPVYLDTPLTDDRAKSFTKHDTKNNCLQVKCGSVKELVEILCLSEDEPLRQLFEYETYVSNWFLTFQSFTTTKEFMSLLKARFHSAYEEGKDTDLAEMNAENVLSILKHWINMEYASDFALDEDLSKSMLRFLEKDAREKFSDKVASIKVFYDNQLKLFKERPIPNLTDAPTPIQPKKKETPLTVFDMDPLEIARQITILESEIFRSIRCKEFHKVAWAKRNASDIAPNLTELINLSNRISNWIVTEILKTKTYEDMAELITKFIKVAQHCMSFHNYSGVMEVVNALSNPAINKLKGAQALIPHKNKDSFEHLSSVISPLGHYKNYRVAFSQRPNNHPCLPILVATLSDLNGYEEVFSNTTNDGAVNWAKMTRIASRIYENMSVNTYYEFKSVEVIQNYIKESPLWVDSLTTCAIADLKVAELNKVDNKSTKRKSTSGFVLDVESEDERDVLTEKDWSYLLTRADPPRTYKEGQVILGAGSPNDKLYRIKQGSVNVVKEINGEAVVVDKMSENAMFGEISMLLRSQKATATASIVAKGDVEVFVLNIEFVMKLLESLPSLAEKLNRILALKLAHRLRYLGAKPPTVQKSESKKNLRDSEKREDEKSEKVDKAEKTSKQTPLEKMLQRLGLSKENVIRAEVCTMKGSSTGTLLITQNHVGFYGKVFGSITRSVVHFGNISEIKKRTVSDKRQIVIQFESESDIVFTNLDDLDGVFKLLVSLWSHQKNSGSKDKKSKKSDKRSSDRRSQEEDKSAWLPSQEDWSKILKGSRTVTYQKDDIIIKEGEKHRRVFQLLKGEIRFEKLIEGQMRVLGKMDKDGDQLFGEISFLEGGKASANVVCDQADTQVAVIEGYFLETLFQYYPELSGRFYHYIANILSKRLKQREGSLNPQGDAKKKKKKREKSDVNA